MLNITDQMAICIILYSEPQIYIFSLTKILLKTYKPHNMFVEWQQTYHFHMFRQMVDVKLL